MAIECTPNNYLLPEIERGQRAKRFPRLLEATIFESNSELEQDLLFFVCFIALNRLKKGRL